MSFFTVAIVGRPNVGKSTLFNVLSQKNLSIVEDTPGVTVDYKKNFIKLFNTKIAIIDTGGITHNIKLTKSDKKDLDKLNTLISNNSLNIAKKADLILLVLDAKEGLTLEDKEISLLLRKINKNIVLVINKTDTKISKLNIPEITTLGFKDLVEISALHKTSLNELYNKIENYYNEYSALNNQISKFSNPDEENESSPYLSIAIVGKPNTGKSTLINALLKEERLVVSNLPGTTKDSISTYFNYNSKYIRVIDTAGLIKKNKVNPGIDTLAKNETIRSIIFAQVVVLVIDSIIGLTKQDLSLASYIIKEGRALVIAINKIDLIKNPQQLKNHIEYILNNRFSEIKGINIILLSGLKSININKLFIESLKVYKNWSTIIKTSLLNKWLNNIVSNNPPPLCNGKVLKIKFISQEKTRPPTFNLWINLKTVIPKQYLGYLRNQLYKTFDLWSSPIRFNIKHNKNPYIK